jgi:RNA polymerase-binding transcription factor DksA
MTAEHTPEQLQRWQRELARKGMELYAALSDVLAGKNVTMATVKLPHEQKPGETKEERLRRFLGQVSRAQKRMNTDAWGRCVQCQSLVPAALLDEAPWTEVCGNCDAL